MHSRRWSEGPGKIAIPTGIESLLIINSDILNAGTSSNELSYISQAMSPIFEQVLRLKGRGAPIRRKEELQRSICSIGGVWLEVRHSIEAAFDSMFMDSFQSLRLALEDHFDGIHGKFNMACFNAGATTPEEKQKEKVLQQEMRRRLDEVRPMVNGPISDLARQCGDRSPRKESS